MLPGWELGPWRADPASLQEDQERKMGGRGEAGSPDVTPWERPGEALTHGAKGGKEAWSSCGLVLCGRLVILLF